MARPAQSAVAFLPGTNRRDQDVFGRRRLGTHGSSNTDRGVVRAAMSAHVCRYRERAKGLLGSMKFNSANMYTGSSLLVSRYTGRSARYMHNTYPTFHVQHQHQQGVCILQPYPELFQRWATGGVSAPRRVTKRSLRLCTPCQLNPFAAGTCGWQAAASATL